MNIPTVRNNIDICLFDAKPEDFAGVSNFPEKSVLFGELKGGIDPAGADEHWKTGNSALERIRSSFAKTGIIVQTIFIGAAIERKMAQEIFSQLSDGTLTNAANLTKDKQLLALCDWIISHEN